MLDGILYHIDENLGRGKLWQIHLQTYIAIWQNKLWWQIYSPLQAKLYG